MEGCLRPRARDACLLQRALGLTGNHAAWKEWLRVPTCIPSWRQPIPGESGYVAATQSNRTSSTAALAALTHRVSGPAGRHPAARNRRTSTVATAELRGHSTLW